MRALILQTPGNPPQLTVAERPKPIPAAGEALVRVAARGFCHHDRLVMAGALRRGVRPGITLGHEIAGIVEETAPGVHRVQPGDRVVALLTNACGQCDRCRAGRQHRCRRGPGIGHARDGGFAEYAALSQHSLIRLPDALPLTQSALLACPAGVARQALIATALAPGETVAITGADGGLGVHAVQPAAALGARIIPPKSPIPNRTRHRPSNRNRRTRLRRNNNGPNRRPRRRRNNRHRRRRHNPIIHKKPSAIRPPSPARRSRRQAI